ncbi:MAG: hypothetical protein NTW19_05585 [Planctomycetota bacterium]|nr:hypothetical protein [Planctomycetota bacterium]
MPRKEAAAAADKSAEALERLVAAAAAAGLEQAKAERLRQERVAQARAQAATQKAAVVPAPAQAGANVARQPAGQMAQQAAGAADLQGLAMAARQFAGGGGQPPPPPQPVQQQGDDLFAVAAPPGPWVYKLYVLDRYSGVLVEERDLTPLSEAIDPAHAVFLDNRVVLTAGDSTVVIPGAVK